jgi:Ca-activated chloride channel family protein
MITDTGINVQLIDNRLAGNVAGILMKQDKYDAFVAKYGEVSVANAVKAALAGDLKLGYKTDSHGCILLGESFAVLEHQNAITNSKKTIDAFHAFMDFQPFKLVIQ